MHFITLEVIELGKKQLNSLTNFVGISLGQRLSLDINIRTK